MIEMKNFAGISLFTISFGLVITALSVFMAIPQLRFGIFMQVEPVNAAFLTSTGIVGIGVAASFIARPPSFRRCLLNPLVILPIAIACWSAFASLFTNLPLASWFGTPHVGEGVLSYTALAILICGGLQLRSHKTARIFVSICFHLVAALLLLSHWGRNNIQLVDAWINFSKFLPGDVSAKFPVPYYFNDYAAFYGFFLLPIAYFGCQRTPFVKPALAISGLISVAAIVISDNLAAYVALIMYVPAAAIILILAKRVGNGWLNQKVAGSIMAASVGLIVTASVIGIPSVVEKIGYDKFEVSGEITSAWRTLMTLESRRKLANVIFDEISDEPAKVLFGSGWGSYRTLLVEHIQAGTINLRDDYDETSVANSWDAVNRVDFHSHNYIIDPLGSVGLLGAILVYLFYAAPALWGRKNTPYITTICIGGLCITAGMWFQMAASLPFMALAFSSLASWRPVNLQISIGMGKIPIGILAAMSCALILVGVESGRIAKLAFNYSPSLEAPASGKESLTNCLNDFSDYGRGGYHLGYRLRVYSRFVISQIQQKKQIDDSHIKSFRGLLCAAEAYIDARPSLQLEVAGLLARADLAFAPQNVEIDGIRSAFLSNWEPRLHSVLKKAPKRTDLAASFLLWNLTEGNDPALVRTASFLYESNPLDPVGLWFTGIILAGAPKTGNEGIRRMRSAIENGIERIIPVDAALKTELAR